MLLEVYDVHLQSHFLGKWLSHHFVHGCVIIRVHIDLIDDDGRSTQMRL